MKFSFFDRVVFCAIMVLSLFTFVASITGVLQPIECLISVGVAAMAGIVMNQERAYARRRALAVELQAQLARRQNMNRLHSKTYSLGYDVAARDIQNAIRKWGNV